MANEKKATRARAPEKKAEQFEKILKDGREMFVKFGSHGFSMRALARKLGMTQPNLYNYVKSKRELWIAIRQQYFEDLNAGMKNLINEHEGDYVELFMKIGEFFLDFAVADYKRYQMMFLISAPRSKKVGPLERDYEMFGTMKMMFDVVRKAQKELKIQNNRTPNLLYYIFSSIFGAAWTISNLKLRAKITEPISGGFYDLSSKEMRDFVLNEIRDRLNRILSGKG
jgi:AcrR family transcriptional regulator